MGYKDRTVKTDRHNGYERGYDQQGLVTYCIPVEWVDGGVFDKPCAELRRRIEKELEWELLYKSMWKSGRVGGCGDER